MSRLIRFWNAYKWLTKGMVTPHVIVVVAMVRSFVRADYSAIALLIVFYVTLMMVMFDSLERGNVLKHIKKEDSVMYRSAKRVSDMEIYGE